MEHIKQIAWTNKKRLTIVVFVVLLFVLGLYVLEKRNVTDIFNSDSPDTLTEDGIDYGPPSDNEIAAGEIEKNKNNSDESVSDSDNQNNKTVSVIITDAGQYGDTIEVRAFVPDHYQDGNCIIDFQKDGHTVTKRAPAYKDISTTICTNPLIKRSEFPTAGTWQVSVTYTADGAKGVSVKQSLEIK